MTLFVNEQAIDPTGLDGERVHRNESNLPHMVEIWSYRSELTLAAIHDAWITAPRTERRFVVLGCRQYRETAGRRFVQLDLYVDPSPRKAVPHIDEPTV